MIQKLPLLGLRAHCYFCQAPTHAFEGKVLVQMWQRDLWIPSPLMNTMKCFFLNKLVFWFYRDFIILRNRVESMKTHIKDFPSHLDFLNTVTLEFHFSCSFTPVFLCRLAFSFFPCVFILHGSFQLTHSVSVMRQIRRSKITVCCFSLFRVNKLTFKDSSPWLLCLGQNWSIPSLPFILHLTC
jgi:hypothetical protein